MKPPVTVRRAGAGDEPVLLGPWLSYCRFSGVEFPPSVSDSVIRRICDPENRMNALLAMDDLGVALGFVNYLMHDFTFGDSYACLAEDLFVRPVARGLGVGTLLMSSLLALARSEGCARIYWVTHESNHAARRMFDEHFARPDGNIRYSIDLTSAVPVLGETPKIKVTPHPETDPQKAVARARSGAPWLNDGGWTVPGRSPT